jgi:hypothetical protein
MPNSVSRLSAHAESTNQRFSQTALPTPTFSTVGVFTFLLLNEQNEICVAS